MKVNTVVGHPSNVAKNHLDKNPMHVVRSMHVYADLLHGVAEIRTRHGEVLKSVGDNTVLRCVGSRLSVVETLDLVSARVVDDLQSSIPARSRRSYAY